jgi:hypothetical protein
MLKLICIQCVLFFGAFILTWAEPSERRILLSVRIVDCADGRHIPYAELFNETSRTGTLADSCGLVNLYAQPGDTLVMQSIGYLGKVWIVTTDYGNDIDTFYICPQAYELGEVNLDFPLSYDQLRHDFLIIEPDRGLVIEGLPEAKVQDIPVLMDTNIIYSTGFAIFHPLSYLYYKYNKEERSKREVFYLKRREREQLIIDKKYNRQLIENITGLKGDEITDFIVFCNFSHEFLYKASELEITETIDRKFREYQVIKNNDMTPDNYSAP